MPIGFADTLPVSRKRCPQRTALLTPMLNRTAAARTVLPASSAATTRKRKSSEYAFAIHAGLLPQPAS